MTVTINGTSGITDVNGTAAAPAITGTDTDTGVFFGTNTVSLSTGGTERVTLDASGNLGVGTTSPAAKLNLGSGGAARFNRSDNATYGEIFYGGSGVGMKYVDYNNDGHRFFNNTTQTMTIDTIGNLLVGTTSAIVSGSARPCYQVSNSDGWGWIARNSNATAGKYWDVQVSSSNTVYFINNGSTGVQMSDGATSWASYSDERLKTDLTPIQNAAQKVSSLRAVTGRYTTDEEGVSRAFLIAQDVQSVLPEAVTSETLVNSDDQTSYLTLSYTDVIPLLVAAIKEQQAIITQLQSDVAALKGNA